MNGINESSFISTLLPKQKIAYLKKLNNFDPKLLLILNDEVKQGNKILNVSDLSDDTMVVLLSHPFKRRYQANGFQFESSNNLHDGGDSYSTHQLKSHTLTAPLKH